MCKSGVSKPVVPCTADFFGLINHLCSAGEFVNLYLLLQITFSLGCILYIGSQMGKLKKFFFNLSLAR